MSLADLSPAQKEELVVSLAALLLSDSGVDMSGENIEAVIKVRSESKSEARARAFMPPKSSRGLGLSVPDRCGRPAWCVRACKSIG